MKPKIYQSRIQKPHKTVIKKQSQVQAPITHTQSQETQSQEAQTQTQTGQIQFNQIQIQPHQSQTQISQNIKNSIVSKNRPKKDNSAFNINMSLHSEQSNTVFIELQKKMEKIRFLQFKGDEFIFDINRLKEELIAAEKHHPFVNKAIKMWKSIPLRSFDGLEGKEGNEGGGINNSPDPNRYKDTTVMDRCPYIKEILDNLNVPILKVRLMRLEPNNILPEHVDQFRDDRIFRMHIPIVTHPDVLFYVEDKPTHLPEGSLWYVNVRKSHKVHNKSKIIRVHLVFDVWITDEFIKNTLEPSISRLSLSI